MWQLQDISSNDELDYILNKNYFYENDDLNEERKSKDSTTNTFGISLIELFKSYGIHIVNGRSKTDDEGESTCTAYEGCSIVDYCIIASKLLPFLCSFEISHRTESFHFPIEFSFDFPLKGITNNVQTGNSDRCFSKYKWSEENKTRFPETFTAILSENKNNIIHAIETNVNNAVQQIVNLYQKCWFIYEEKR